MDNKHIFLVLSDKGGTGKSLFTRGLADYIVRNNQQENTLFVDGDGEVGQLLQNYKEYGVISAQISTQEKRDKFVDILESEKELIIADLPAASIFYLTKLEQEIGFFELLKQHAYKLTLCTVLSPFKASIRSVKASIDLAGDQANYIVVKNRFFGSDEDFHLYHEGQGKKLLRQHKGLEIELPSISTGVLAKLDIHNLSFLNALNNHSIKLAYRCRINKFLHTLDLELDKLNLFDKEAL